MSQASSDAGAADSMRQSNVVRSHHPWAEARQGFFTVIAASWIAHKATVFALREEIPGAPLSGVPLRSILEWLFDWVDCLYLVAMTSVWWAIAWVVLRKVAVRWRIGWGASAGIGLALLQSPLDFASQVGAWVEVAVPGDDGLAAATEFAVEIFVSEVAWPLGMALLLLAGARLTSAHSAVQRLVR